MTTRTAGSSPSARTSAGELEPPRDVERVDGRVAHDDLGDAVVDRMSDGPMGSRRGPRALGTGNRTCFTPGVHAGWHAHERARPAGQSRRSSRAVRKGIGRGIAAALPRGRRATWSSAGARARGAAAGGGREALFVAGRRARARRRSTQVVALHGRAVRAARRAREQRRAARPTADAATASPRFSAAIIALNLLAPLYFAQRANAVMQAQADGRRHRQHRQRERHAPVARARPPTARRRRGCSTSRSRSRSSGRPRCA